MVVVVELFNAHVCDEWLLRIWNYNNVIFCTYVVCSTMVWELLFGLPVDGCCHVRYVHLSMRNICMILLYVHLRY